jgi:hypothetical protein
MTGKRKVGERKKNKGKEDTVKAKRVWEEYYIRRKYFRNY